MKYLTYAVVWICALIASFAFLYFLRTGWAAAILFLPIIVTDSILKEEKSCENSKENSHNGM